MLRGQSVLREPVTEIMGRRQQLLSELEKANAEIEAHKQDAEARKELFFRRNQASAALNAYDKRAGDELKALVNGLQKWSSSKNGTRLSYLSALHAIVCRERRAIPDPNFVPGTGSIVFYSFPQEVVNQIAERTGGRPVTVEFPICATAKWKSTGKGRIFLVQPFTQANGQIGRTPDLRGAGHEGGRGVHRSRRARLACDPRACPAISHQGGSQ